MSLAQYFLCQFLVFPLSAFSSQSVMISACFKFTVYIKSYKLFQFLWPVCSFQGWDRISFHWQYNSSFNREHTVWCTFPNITTEHKNNGSSLNWIIFQGPWRIWEWSGLLFVTVNSLNKCLTECSLYKQISFWWQTASDFNLQRGRVEFINHGIPGSAMQLTPSIIQFYAHQHSEINKSN